MAGGVVSIVCFMFVREIASSPHYTSPQAIPDAIECSAATSDNGTVKCMSNKTTKKKAKKKNQIGMRGCEDSLLGSDVISQSPASRTPKTSCSKQLAPFRVPPIVDHSSQPCGIGIQSRTVGALPNDTPRKSRCRACLSSDFDLRATQASPEAKPT
ncbi:hypothetical protein VTK56DRAFT_2640 [Thermocarpiscus australiensis]